jgi:lipoyl-dependent peroxiredoxin
MKIFYSATATAKGGRAGHARSSDGAPDVTLTIPKELGADGRLGTNPEQMFAAGYAASFQSALHHVAAQQKTKIGDTSITATVGLGPRDVRGFGHNVDMEVSISGVERADAQGLVDYVHSVVCPYSNAIRGNVEVNIRVV